MGRPRLPPRELRQPKCAHLSSRNIRAHTVRDFPARTCGWYHRHAPTTFFYRLPPVPKPHRRYNPTIAGPPLPYKFRERHRATGRPYLQRLPYRAPEYLRHRAKRLHTSASSTAGHASLIENGSSPARASRLAGGNNSHERAGTEA